MKKADVYMDNRKCLLLIPEVVDNFRKQMFFKGTQGLSELLNKMNTVINYIFEEAECIDLREEAQQTLEAVLEAQTNQDYILQADIIEEDLKPLLQQLQLKLQK